MAGADEGYIPRPEKKNPVFGTGSPAEPYFEKVGEAAPFDSALQQPRPIDRQLDLGEEEVRLPWLEGDDEEYADEKAGIGQGVLLGVLGLAALVLIGGAVFWVVKSRPEQPLVADGGVIAAPKGPYKSRPENPGGEVVAGTGDTSFEVAEGKSRAPQIDGRAETAGPGFETAAAPSAKPSTAAVPSAAPVGGVGVQVGAYASREKAEAGWATLKTQYEPLGGISHRVVEGKADIGTVYRLQAVPGDGAAARALCSGMKSAGMSCQIKN
ncbi:MULTISPECIES: SPOR domain-containing protein [unclassified Novosphingobium]|uniref:SPOR domain-containing protein n=1 Tax=unclassified Novosphingobium TaxID=2644732 RepID=UPI00135A6D4D|nr:MULTISPECIES: SPOR domain-containing protein [unclassified Novosphingobium]